MKKEFNEACMMKLGWAAVPSNSLWARWFRARYFRSGPQSGIQVPLKEDPVSGRGSGPWLIISSVVAFGELEMASPSEFGWTIGLDHYPMAPRFPHLHFLEKRTFWQTSSTTIPGTFLPIFQQSFRFFSFNLQVRSQSGGLQSQTLSPGKVTNLGTRRPAYFENQTSSCKLVRPGLEKVYESQIGLLQLAHPPQENTPWSLGEAERLVTGFQMQLLPLQ
eukprot:TRINITY_DN15785_c1_g1_i1.p1 TRINITY_DN15785_c1_g1~~TRINITY_DN15785_c1_g1_i1.p1  ORF type:complete len:219 (-),score=29.71 TRINITY_DN15785_c1_g1_i1:517-1173(-)